MNSFMSSSSGEDDLAFHTPKTHMSNKSESFFTTRSHGNINHSQLHPVLQSTSSPRGHQPRQNINNNSMDIASIGQISLTIDDYDYNEGEQDNESIKKEEEDININMDNKNIKLEEHEEITISNKSINSISISLTEEEIVNVPSFPCSISENSVVYPNLSAILGRPLENFKTKLPPKIVQMIEGISNTDGTNETWYFSYNFKGKGLNPANASQSKVIYTNQQTPTNMRRKIELSPSTISKGPNGSLHYERTQPSHSLEETKESPGFVISNKGGRNELEGFENWWRSTTEEPFIQPALTPPITEPSRPRAINQYGMVDGVHGESGSDLSIHQNTHILGRDIYHEGSENIYISEDDSPSSSIYTPPRGHHMPPVEELEIIYNIENNIMREQPIISLEEIIEELREQQGGEDDSGSKLFYSIQLFIGSIQWCSYRLHLVLSNYKHLIYVFVLYCFYLWLIITLFLKVQNSGFQSIILTFIQIIFLIIIFFIFFGILIHPGRLTPMDLLRRKILLISFLTIILISLWVFIELYLHLEGILGEWVFICWLCTAALVPISIEILLIILLISVISMIICFPFELIYLLICNDPQHSQDRRNGRITVFDYAEDRYEQKVCCICLDNFRPGLDKVCELACSRNHIFHFGCIREWLRNRTTCPYCRSIALIQ